MAILVIGGHARSVGKTAVMAAVIAGLPEMRWTAIKISQHRHEDGSADGENEAAGTAFAISEEHDPASGKDSARYLRAGAVRSFWVRTRRGSLADAMPRVRELIAAAENVIVESNSVLDFLQPDMLLFVADPRIREFKPSALRCVDRVDAWVMVATATEEQCAWEGVSPPLPAQTPSFTVPEGTFLSEGLAQFLRARLRMRP